MKPNYVARRSAVGKDGFLLSLLFCWLIIPAFFLIGKIVSAKYETIEFYDDVVVINKGVINKSKRRQVLTRIISVSMDQTLGGRMFNYGNVYLDVVGKLDLNLHGIKDPQALEAYLQERVAAPSDFHQIISE